MSSVRTLALCAVLLPLAGCSYVKSLSIFKAGCAKPIDVASIVDRPALVVPAGRDAPDTRAALPIPKLDTPEAPVPPMRPASTRRPNTSRRRSSDRRLDMMRAPLIRRDGRAVEGA